MALNLTDLIDLTVLEDLAQSIWRCSGLPTKIADPLGRILVSSGSQEICLLFHRRHPALLERCIESDTEKEALLRTKAAEGTLLETRCRSGLNHIGLPIVINKEHLATLYLAQFFYDPPDENLFRRKARRFGFDEERYLAALRKVPVLGRTRVKEGVAFCEVLVKLLSEMGAREAALLDSREKLRESEERFRNVIESTPLGIHLYQLEKDGRLVLTGANPAADAILGMELAPHFGRTLEEVFPALAATEVPARYREVCRGSNWEAGEVPYRYDHISGIYEVHAFPTGAGRMATIFADITERKRREEELRYRERFEALIAAISTRFMEEGPAGLDGTIESTLRQLIEFAGVDRAYLICLSDEGTRLLTTHEACTGALPCERKRLHDLAVSDSPWIMGKLLERTIVHIPRVADLPAEAAGEKTLFTAQGVQSLLSVPVFIEGKMAGLVGFEAVQAEKSWDERDIVLLRTFGDLLGSALERRRAHETLEYRAQLEHLIATLSTRMLSLDAESIDTAIDEALGEIGIFVGVDRCYIFRFSDDGRRFSNTHEWCAPQISSFKEVMRDLPTSAYPWALGTIFRREVLLVADTAVLPPEAGAEKAEFERQMIRSILCVPMLTDERVIGMIGFDAVRRRKDWSPEIVQLLRLVGEFFANAFERRRRDRALRENRERIAAILRSLRAGLVGVDQEGRITLLNKPAAVILGLEGMDPRGRLLSDLPVEPLLQDQIAAVLAGRNPAPAEWSLTPGQSGPARIIQSRTDPIRSEERLRRGAIAMLRDVSAEREIDRIKSEFISTAAHELRTPLSSVLGYAELLLRQASHGTFPLEEQRDYLEEIVRRAEDLTELVNDLLDLSRIESGQLVRLNLSLSDPGRLIREVIEDFRRRITDRHFEVEAPPFLPEILIDAAKIRQVLENLLGNAVKFSPPESRIQVGAHCREDRIRVEVKDEGSGMSPEVIAHIFDKFYRGNADSSVPGLGLGMSIVKNIVEGHDGEIQVESAPGIGTRVIFTLPLPRS